MHPVFHNHRPCQQVPMPLLSDDLSRLLEDCETLMLDMDGTLLDLAFDNYMWKERVPEEYARVRGIPPARARVELAARYESVLGTLNWYCLDHWSELLGIDVLALHRQTQDRIGFLPGARDFLVEASARDMRLLLVSNSHPATLAVKTEATGLADWFDHVYLSHDVGHAKEHQAFWQALAKAESLDPARAVFVDDTERVLEAAQSFGLPKLLAITRPDTTQPARSCGAFTGIERVAELLAPG
jgi:5'-nucleotidase